jgi:hypothetical protein
MVNNVHLPRIDPEDVQDDYVEWIEAISADLLRMIFLNLHVDPGGLRFRKVARRVPCHRRQIFEHDSQVL